MEGTSLESLMKRENNLLIFNFISSLTRSSLCLLFLFPERKEKERTQGSNLRDSVANNPGSWNPWTYSPDRQVPTSNIKDFGNSL